MKRTIASLAFLALELIACFISSKWGIIEVKDSAICFKPIFNRMSVSPMHHRHLQIGPMVSARYPHNHSIPEHFTHDETRTEMALFISGISLIISSAVVLAVLQFCLPTTTMQRYRPWLHLLNFILLLISFVLLISGFYRLHQTIQHPLNGAAALGFFIGILFIVALATHSVLHFWSHFEEGENVMMEKEIK